MSTPAAPYALIRRPAETLADGIVTFIERQPIDLDLAKRAVGRLRRGAGAHGWSTVVIDGDDAMPDCVFVEDAVVMFGDLAVITNPRQPDPQPGDGGSAKTVAGSVSRRSRSPREPSTAATC